MREPGQVPQRPTTVRTGTSVSLDNRRALAILFSSLVKPRTVTALPCSAGDSSRDEKKEEEVEQRVVQHAFATPHCPLHTGLLLLSGFPAQHQS